MCREIRAKFHEARKRYEFRVEVKKEEARMEFEEALLRQKEAFTRILNAEMEHMKMSCQALNDQLFDRERLIKKLIGFVFKQEWHLSMFEARKQAGGKMDPEDKASITRALREKQYVTNEERLKLECHYMTEAIESLTTEA